MRDRSHFRRGEEPTFECRVCGRRTRNPDHSGTYLCSQCYDLASLDNQVNDDCREITPDEIVERDRWFAEATAKGGDGERIKRCCTFLWRAS